MRGHGYCSLAVRRQAVASVLDGAVAGVVACEEQDDLRVLFGKRRIHLPFDGGLAGVGADADGEVFRHHSSSFFLGGCE